MIRAQPPPTAFERGTRRFGELFVQVTLMPVVSTSRLGALFRTIGTGLLYFLAALAGESRLL